MSVYSHAPTKSALQVETLAYITLQIKSNDIKAGYHRSETIFAGLPGNLEQLLITALDDNGAEWLQKNNFAFPNIQNIQVIHARLSHEHNAGYITERGIMGLYHFIKHCRILQSLSVNLMMENNTLTIAAWQIFLIQGTTNTKRLVLVFSHLPRSLKHLTLVSFVLNHRNFIPLAWDLPHEEQVKIQTCSSPVHLVHLNFSCFSEASAGQVSGLHTET